MKSQSKAQSLLNKIKDNFRGEVMLEEPMSGHTSLKIGGPAEVVVFPEDPLSLKNVLIAAGEEKMPVFVLGAGTNLLVGDRGVKGVGISLREFRNIELIKGSDDRNAVLFAEAGVPVSLLLNYTGKNGYSGIEPLAGIPGTFGGAVYMNAGSFGTEIKDVIVSVAVMNREGSIRILHKEEISFSYRNSNISDDMIIMSANIKLERDDAEAVGRRIRDYLRRKRESQPIGEASAGCVFKNPVEVDQNRTADTAGSLIERAGCKGMSSGDVEVSMAHANYFINRGKATCREFIELMETVVSKVEQFSGVRLEPELKIVGEI